MSWQSYVDDQLLAAKVTTVTLTLTVSLSLTLTLACPPQTVSKACIAGHDGNIWATSEGFAATAAELKVNH